MRAPVSVVIPTLNVSADIGPLLSTLLDGMNDSLLCEVVLADGGSTDGVERLAEVAGCLLVRSELGRGRQLAAGVAAAQGPWLLVLHADSVPQPGWIGAVRAHLEHPNRAGYFALQFDQGGAAARAVAGWANLRSRLFGLPYGDQGLLISRDLYSAVGGYREIPLMEDVALARRLRGHLHPLAARITTSARRYQDEGWLRRGTHNLTTLAMYLAGVSPDRLAARYSRASQNVVASGRAEEPRNPLQ